MPWKTAPSWAIDFAETGNRKYGTPTGVTLAVAQLESSFRPDAINKSSGAVGIMQVLPKYAGDYDRLMASVDPALKGLDLRSQKAVQGLAAVLEYNRRLAVKRGITGNIAPWQWAVVAHRWGQNSEQIRTYQTQQRTLDVERLMRENGYWYNEKEDTMGTYSLSKDGNKALSANFKVKEFAVGSGFNGDVVKISNDLVRMLQLIRNHYGKAVNISSGYRPNERATSQHYIGTAADFRIDGVNPRDIVRWIETEIDPPGLGLYDYDPATQGKTGFVHIDCRTGAKSRWYQTKADDSDYTPIGNRDITAAYLDKT